MLYILSDGDISYMTARHKVSSIVTGSSHRLSILYCIIYCVSHSCESRLMRGRLVEPVVKVTEGSDIWPLDDLVSV